MTFYTEDEFMNGPPTLIYPLWSSPFVRLGVGASSWNVDLLLLSSTDSRNRGKSGDQGDWYPVVSNGSDYYVSRNSGKLKLESKLMFKLVCTQGWNCRIFLTLWAVSLAAMSTCPTTTCSHLMFWSLRSSSRQHWQSTSSCGRMPVASRLLEKHYATGREVHEFSMYLPDIMFLKILQVIKCSSSFLKGQRQNNVWYDSKSEFSPEEEVRPIRSESLIGY